MTRTHVTYEGLRYGNALGDISITADGKKLPMRQELVHHADEYEWGFLGGGAFQLALAILTHHLEYDKIAMRLYKEFANDVVKNMNEGGWDLSSNHIAAWVNASKVNYAELWEGIAT